MDSRGSRIDSPYHHPGQVAYGGFWVRVIAYIIDLVIIWVLLYLVSALLFVLIGGGEATYFQIKHLNPSTMPPETLARPFVTAGLLLSTIAPWLYFTLFESSRYQATPGKKVMSLKVLFYIGFLMIGWTKHKQGLHDKIARTFVVRQ